MKIANVDLPGNPAQSGRPVGIGKTVYPDHQFKSLNMLIFYWRAEIGRTSNHIHKTKQ